MSDIERQEFLRGFQESVRERIVGAPDDDNIQELSPREEALTAEFLERLADGNHIPDMNFVHYPTRLLGNANAQASAYAYHEIERTVHLVVTIRPDENIGTASQVLPKSKVIAAAKRALHVFKSSRQPIYREMEPASTATDMFKLLHKNYGQVSEIRVHVLVDGDAKKAELEQPDGLPDIKLDVWDHVRLHRVCSSGLPYEAIKIDLLDYVDDGIPFVVSDVRLEDHQCYLTVFEAGFLHDIYDTYGPRLLELNVRSFLQARGKVNKGIRATLKNDPDHFLAYNNGISATVEELTIKDRKDGSKGIFEMHGLQIVNGGQTTASIHRAKKLDKVDLSRVRVQIKITKVKPEHLDDLVPKISRFSNTQNKVNETDFSANHPYHVKLQQLSERNWAPGETSRWFYERARGQWEVARSKEGTTPVKKRAFDAKTPKRQRIDKILLAKSENSWNRKPHIVSRGAQKNFVEFMTDVDETLPDDSCYRETVAKIILFKATEKIAREIGFSAYRANAITYTTALLSYRTNSTVDLGEIWRNQSIPLLIADVLREWMPLVHDCITETAVEQDKNVTEWAKKPECWAVVQNLQLEVSSALEDILTEGMPLPTVGAYRDGGTMRPLTEEESRRQTHVMAMAADEFAKILNSVGQYQDDRGGMHYGAWSAMTGCLTTLQMYAQNNWTNIPTPKQTKQILKAIDFLNEREND